MIESKNARYWTWLGVFNDQERPSIYVCQCREMFSHIEAYSLSKTTSKTKSFWVPSSEFCSHRLATIPLLELDRGDLALRGRLLRFQNKSMKWNGWGLGLGHKSTSLKDEYYDEIMDVDSPWRDQPWGPASSPWRRCSSSWHRSTQRLSRRQTSFQFSARKNISLVDATSNKALNVDDNFPIT